jgi:hypothetical protein
MVIIAPMSLETLRRWMRFILSWDIASCWFAYTYPYMLDGLTSSNTWSLPYYYYLLV